MNARGSPEEETTSHYGLRAQTSWTSGAALGLIGHADRHHQGSDDGASPPGLAIGSNWPGANPTIEISTKRESVAQGHGTPVDTQAATTPPALWSSRKRMAHVASQRCGPKAESVCMGITNSGFGDGLG